MATLNSTTTFIGSVVILALIVSLFSDDASACSCMAKNLDEQLADSEYVFLATVIGTRLTGAERTEVLQKEWEPNNTDQSARVLIYFDPIKNYKGDSSNLKYLSTGSQGSACGVPVWPTHYWVFFVKEDGFVSLCGGSFRSFGGGWRDEDLQKLIDREKAGLRDNKSFNTDASETGSG